MNNKSYRAATLLGDIIKSAQYSAENIAANAEIIDNFCDNMPDDAISHIYGSSYALSFSIRGTGEELTAAIRWLRTRGWNTDSKPPETNQAHWDALYVHTEDLNKIRIRLTFSSTVCRMVKVGTKMVEQDVYETRCGPEAVPDGDQNETAGAEVAPAEESAEG